jgi:hypothetical protein
LILTSSSVPSSVKLSADFLRTLLIVRVPHAFAVERSESSANDNFDNFTPISFPESLSSVITNSLPKFPLLVFSESRSEKINDNIVIKQKLIALSLLNSLLKRCFLLNYSEGSFSIILWFIMMNFLYYFLGREQFIYECCLHIYNIILPLFLSFNSLVENQKTVDLSLSSLQVRKAVSIAIHTAALAINNTKISVNNELKVLFLIIYI